MSEFVISEARAHAIAYPLPSFPSMWFQHEPKIWLPIWMSEDHLIASREIFDQHMSRLMQEQKILMTSGITWLDNMWKTSHICDDKARPQFGDADLASMLYLHDRNHRLAEIRRLHEFSERVSGRYRLSMMGLREGLAEERSGLLQLEVEHRPKTLYTVCPWHRHLKLPPADTINMVWPQYAGANLFAPEGPGQALTTMGASLGALDIMQASLGADGAAYVSLASARRQPSRAPRPPWPAPRGP